MIGRSRPVPQERVALLSHQEARGHPPVRARARPGALWPVLLQGHRFHTGQARLVPALEARVGSRPLVAAAAISPLDTARRPLDIFCRPLDIFCRPHDWATPTRVRRIGQRERDSRGRNGISNNIQCECARAWVQRRARSEVTSRIFWVAGETGILNAVAPDRPQDRTRICLTMLFNGFYYSCNVHIG